MKERTNAGFKIIKAIKFGEFEYVLGEKIKPNFVEYVTWRCFNEINYQFGHYFNSFNKANLDLYIRIQAELSFIIENLQEAVNNEEQ